MFILSELLIQYQFPELLASKFGPFFQKIFHTSPYGIFALIMSLLSGTPSSAYILKKLVDDQKISAQEASHLLKFTFFSNPLFLLTMLNLIFPNQQSLIWSIIFIHYSCNLIIGFLFRPKITLTGNQISIHPNSKSLGNLLSSAIKNSMSTLTLILGTICFYLMISTIISIQNPQIQVLTNGLLELTQGLNCLISSPFSKFTTAIIAISFISFGGLSIHTQIISILENTNILYIPFLKGRIFHVLFSILLLFILTCTGITIIS